MRGRMAWGMWFLAGACGGGEQPAPAPPPTEAPDQPAPAAPAERPDLLMRGIVRLQPPMFRSCDGNVVAELIDSTAGRLVPTFSILQATEQDGLYVLARGAFGERREVVLRELQLATRPAEREGCEQPDPEYVIMARGLGPAWHVRVLASGIEYSQEGEAASLTFPAVAPQDSAGRTIYQTTSAAPDSHTLRLSLLIEGCAQGDAIYGSMQAEVTVDGTTLQGCAWRGVLK